MAVKSDCDSQLAINGPKIVDFGGSKLIDLLVWRVCAGTTFALPPGAALVWPGAGRVKESWPDPRPPFRDFASAPLVFKTVFRGM